MAISLPQHTANLLALCYALDLPTVTVARILSWRWQTARYRHAEMLRNVGETRLWLRPSTSENDMYKLLSIVLATSLFFASTQAGEKAAISNKVKWVTASEVDNFGFDVFRSENEEGPFEKINKDTIAGAGTVDTPNRYQFTDDGIEAGKRYWYYVESISMSGQREKFTPTFQSKPNYPETDD